MAGADPAELGEIANPHGRLLALALRARVALEGHARPGRPPARHEVLADVLRELHGDEDARRLQHGIVSVAPGEAPPTESRNRHFDDVLEDESAELEMIVANRLPVGLTVFAGRPKVGKGWLVLDLAVAIARGLPVLGVTEVQRGAVMYWALEDYWGRLKRRALKQGVEKGAPILVRTKPGRLPECVGEFHEDLEQYQPKAVFIDTLSRILPPGARLNDSGEMTQALDAMQQLAFDYRCALVLVHHQRKNLDSSDHLDSVLGATGIAGAADAIYSLTRTRGDDTAVLSITGRDIDAELTLGLRFDRRTCRWVTRDMTERPGEPTSLRVRIARAVTQLEAADAQTIAKATGNDRSTVQLELKRMRMVGDLVASRGSGRRILYSMPGVQGSLGGAEAAEGASSAAEPVDE